ncbi:MAG: insulinase family protein [Chitinophagales bacterium]|nr:insulinase family protein [Chitinophagales bacterium]
MKRISLNIVLSSTLCLLMWTDAFAQNGVEELNVDGLKVYFKHTPKEVISVRLFVDGGTANYTLDKQGVEAMAYNLAVNGGTTSKNKVAFKTAAEKIGTEFGFQATLDYGDIDMTCVKPFWDESWALFTDAVMHPAFDPYEFKLIQDQMIASAKQAEANPDAYLQKLALQMSFKQKNYEKDPQGSSASLTGLTVDDVKSYYSSVIGKGRCFLVVVGNISEDDVTSKVKATLASLTSKSLAKKGSRVVLSTSGQNIVDRDISTNYLCGVMSGPLLNSPDGIPMMMAMNIMYDRFFVELRTKRSLSYAPAAYFNSNAITSPYSMLYISTDTPKKAISVMVDLLNSVKREGFKPEELTDKKEQFLTAYLSGLETSAGQSNAIGRWALRGNVKMYDEFVTRANAVTLKDLNRVIDQNTGAIMWTYLGHKADVQPTDFVQTTVYKNKPY